MPSPFTRTHLITFGLLLLIIGIGAWFRLGAIDQFPPLALYPDEAYYGLDALEIWRGNFMVFSPVNTGREALYMIIAAGVFKVFGVSVLAFRVYTAVLGVLTIPAVFWLGWEVAPNRAHARWLGLLAAASLALLLMHIILNRNALRVNLQPLLTTLSMAALLRAFRLRHWRWFAVAGALLGLSGYTYVTVRALPVVVVFAFALWWPRERTAWRAHLQAFALVAGMAILVYTPLGLYFLQNPERFLYKAQYLFDPNLLGQSIWASLLTFHHQGDYLLYNNLPDRPIFDVVQGVAFWLGVFAVVRGRYPRVGWFLFAWFFSGVLPEALARDAPSYIHAFGMIPPMVVLMGCGYWEAGTWLNAQLRRLPALNTLAQSLGVGLVVLGLGYSGWATYQDFFVQWTSRSDLSLTYRTDLMRIDDYMRHRPADTEVFFSPYFWIEPALEFARVGDTRRLHPYDGHHCVPLGDATTQPLIYFVGDPNSFAVLQQYYPTGQRAAAPEFGVYEVAAGTPLHLATPSTGHATWAEQLALPHAAVTVVDAQTIQVNLLWQTHAPRSEAFYHRFVHLLTDDATQPGGVRLWAQSDVTLCGGLHAPKYWQPGEYIADHLTLSLAEPLPPGDYRLALGLYAEGAPARLSVTSASWPVKDDAVTFATVQIK